jgi:hypothetical protein
VKDAEFVPVRDSGEDEAVGRQAVVLSAGELAVGVNGAVAGPPSSVHRQ